MLTLQVHTGMLIKADRSHIYNKSLLIDQSLIDQRSLDLDLFMACTERTAWFYSAFLLVFPHATLPIFIQSDWRPSHRGRAVSGNKARSCIRLQLELDEVARITGEAEGHAGEQECERDESVAVPTSQCWSVNGAAHPSLQGVPSLSCC